VESGNAGPTQPESQKLDGGAADLKGPRARQIYSTESLRHPDPKCTIPRCGMDNSTASKAARSTATILALNRYKHDVFLHVLVNGSPLVRRTRIDILGARLGCIEPQPGEPK
jgi:hypothetical protein